MVRYYEGIGSKNDEKIHRFAVEDWNSLRYNDRTICRSQWNWIDSL